MVKKKLMTEHTKNSLLMASSLLLHVSEDTMAAILHHGETWLWGEADIVDSRAGNWEMETHGLLMTLMSHCFKQP